MVSTEMAAEAPPEISDPIHTLVPNRVLDRLALRTKIRRYSTSRAWFSSPDTWSNTLWWTLSSYSVVEIHGPSDSSPVEARCIPAVPLLTDR